MKINNSDLLIRTLLTEALEDRYGQPILSEMDKILTKLPAMAKAIKLIMTSKFRFFTKDISIVSPKPTTYRITLNNDYDFLLIYRGYNTYTAKISGKSYDLGSAGDIVKASKAITDLLINGLKPQVQTEMQGGGDGSAGMGGGLGSGGGELSGGGLDGGPSDGVFEPLDGNDDNPLDDSDISDDDLE